MRSQGACYNRAADLITLPPYEAFHDAPGYYNTAFHELAHWTGAPHRLDRVKGKRFGDLEYTYEELVAELTAAFACAEFGIDGRTEEQSAAYLQSWIRFLKDHERAFVSGASQASKAIEYMRGLALAAPAQAAA